MGFNLIPAARKAVGAGITERPMASAVSPAARMRPATMSAPAVAPPASPRARMPVRRGPSSMGLAHASAMGTARRTKPHPKGPAKKPFGSY